MKLAQDNSIEGEDSISLDGSKEGENIPLGWREEM